MARPSSNAEFFQACERLFQRLDEHGPHDAAARLREGFGCLNGLTDGWALLMESMEATLSRNRDELRPEDLAELEGLLQSVRRVVYRR